MKISLITLLIITVIYGCTKSDPEYSYSCLFIGKKMNKCAKKIGPGKFQIAKDKLVKVGFNNKNLGEIYIYGEDAGFVWLDKSGKALVALTFDNGADYFKDGFARITLNNKVGFIDEKLNIVIPPQYDFAFPFNGSYAVFCNDCKKKSVGEYNTLIGGSWGIIDKNNKILKECPKANAYHQCYM